MGKKRDPVLEYKMSKALRIAVLALRQIYDMPTVKNKVDFEADGFVVLRGYYPADGEGDPYWVARNALDQIRKEFPDNEERSGLRTV